MTIHPLINLRWLVAVTPGPPALDSTSLAGYGVIGTIAVFGIGFASWRLIMAEAERKAALLDIKQLRDQLLKQAEAHKAELLEVYRSVMPALDSATRAVQDAAADRREHEIEREVARRTVERRG